jgi:alpha-D-glucose phosphate-specific phosphoglucomutase
MIKFGTSGWRAVIDKEFTFENVGLVARAIGDYLISKKIQKRGVVIGYDTRFRSPEFAAHCASILAARKIPVYLSRRDVPTPAISYAVINRRTAGAINITASHNPPEYNGIKFSPASGAPAMPEVTAKIEKNIRRLSKLQLCSRPVKTKPESAKCDFRPEYFKQIEKIIDLEIIRRAKLTVVVDCLYGTGRGYLDRLLKKAGCKIKLLHGYADHNFGGLRPEPAPDTLKELRQAVKKIGAHLGVACDGDADRFGIIDENGNYVSANQVISLLTDYLAQTRKKRPFVLRTVATTHMVDSIAKSFGLDAVEVPVGFKYIAPYIIKGKCLLGGEESGGLSVAGHVPEKDGILACLLIAEMVAAKARPLRKILEELYKKVGRFFNARNDYKINAPHKKAILAKLKRPFPKKIAGKRVLRVNTLDGYKFLLSDASWLLYRVSGTEPVIRMYCEAFSKGDLKRLIADGKKYLGL